VAVELLFVTGAVRDVIRNDRLADLAAVMKEGREDGILTLDASLEQLTREGVISVEHARRYAREHATGLGE
jgi:twitching motility protein PilT